jgi:adenylate cyclase
VPVDSTDHTFLFADLAGFTALTEVHGDEEAAGLVAEFCDAVRELLPSHGGEEVKTIGDAVMVRLDRPGDGIRLGLAIVEAVRDRPLLPVVRVGMHTGSAVERDGDWLGGGVNLAARVAGSASGDEVLLTESTRKLAGALEGIELESRGSVQFRNIQEPVRVFRAIRSGASRESLPVDPVCRMTVAPEHCAGHLVHDGAAYHFCSFECASAFARDPERYVRPAEPGRAPGPSQ